MDFVYKIYFVKMENEINIDGVTPLLEKNQ